MADTLVKKPVLFVGAKEQINAATMGENDFAIVTDEEFYTSKQIDELLSKAGGASLPILARMWSDHILNDVSWLRADTFSWQSGDVYKAAYEHLVADFENPVKHSVQLYGWGADWYTTAEYPEEGDALYLPNLANGELELGGAVEYYDIKNDTITIRTSAGVSGVVQSRNDNYNVPGEIAEHTDIIGDITITYYLAQDGHKICLPDQESNLIALYEQTGVAWYYLLDTENKQFKLPRTKKPETNFIPDFANQQTVSMPFTAPRDGWFIAHAQNVSTIVSVNGVSVAQGNWQSGQWSGNLNCQIIVKKNDVVTGASGTMRFIPFVEADYNNKDENKHLYFYVGNFEQSATEQTAGLNAELFNGKADRNLLNTTDNVDIVVESQLPTADNGYTWYRKYKSGWVEQGGLIAISAKANTNTAWSATFPVEMASDNYFHQISFKSGWVYNTKGGTEHKLTTTIDGYFSTSNAQNVEVVWEIKGIAAIP